VLMYSSMCVYVCIQLVEVRMSVLLDHHTTPVYVYDGNAERSTQP